MQSLVKLFGAKTGAKAVVILIIIAFIIIAFSTMSVSAPGINYGDVNNDGSIDVRDVVLVMQYIIGLRDLTEDQFKAADVNRDGKVDVQDVTKIMRHVLKIETFTKAIVSVKDVEINVFVNNPAEKLYFPPTVRATLVDDSIEDVNVEWEDASSPSYVAEQIGEYVFKGDLVDLRWGLSNPDVIRATAFVNVIRYDIPPRPVPRPDFDLYRLTLVADPPGSGFTTGSGDYQEGDFIEVSVLAAAGYTFDNWINLEFGTVVSQNQTFIYQMPARDTVLIANFVPAVTLTFEDIGGVVDQIVPGVFNVYVSLADAQANLAGVTTDSIIVLTIPGKDPILLEYNAFRDAFFQASVQGYTETEIYGAGVSVLGVATAEDLNVSIDLLLPGVYNVSIAYDDAEANLPEVTTNSTLILNVIGKDSLELDYNSVRDAFFKPSVQGYTESEIKSAVVTVQ